MKKTYRKIVHRTPEDIVTFLEGYYVLSRKKLIRQSNGNVILSFLLAPRGQLTSFSVSISLMKLPINTTYALTYTYEDNLLIKKYKLIDVLNKL